MGDTFTFLYCLFSLFGTCKNLDLSGLLPSHELYSENNVKVIEKPKLDSIPKNEIDEAVFSWSKPYKFKDPSNSIEWKIRRGVEPYNKYTLEGY